MLSTEYRESIERRFHAFCKAVLHNEACNYYRERKRKAKHEISFEYLQENTSFALHSTDEYFILQDKPTAFAVNGQTVIVYSEKLAKALLCLSKRWRETAHNRQLSENRSFETVAGRNGEDER